MALHRSRVLTSTAAAACLLLLAPSAATAAPAAPAAADDAGQLDLSELYYPGTPPGTAQAELTDEALTIGNSILGATYERAEDGTLRLASFRDEAGETVLTALSQFRLELSDGTTLTPADMSVTAAPEVVRLTGDDGSARLADRDDGYAATTAYAYSDGTLDLTVEWRTELRDGANNLSQQVTLTNASDTSLDGATLTLLDLAAADARVEGNVAGSPVVFGPEGEEFAFAGIENPMSLATADGDGATVALERTNALAAGESWQVSSSIGVAPPDQLRRAFTYYVERNRAHARRTFLHYQSWLDLTPGPSMVIRSDELSEAIDLFGTELTERDAVIDSFWIDDGWDYLREPKVANDTEIPVWSINPVEYPDGFAVQKAQAAEFGDASLSVWMSPFGGYPPSSTRRLELNESKPADERLETVDTYLGKGFQLSGERYYQQFRSTVFDMMDNQGVQGFKFDGIGGGLYQTGPNEAFVEDYEAMLELMTDMREHDDEVFINATVGTWHSPYWLWFADTIWRDGQDASLAGAGDVRQQYINYRDSQTYRNTVATTPLFPVTALMNHGFTFSERTPQFVADYDLTDPQVRAGVAADMRSYFALGLSLQELYVRHTQVMPGEPGAEWFWDELAPNIRWARENTDLLTDAHWVGGDPAYGEVYGTAAWDSAADGERGMLMLRNPYSTAQSIAIDVAEVFELPGGAPGTYAFTDRDGAREDFVATAGTDYHVALDPFEVVVFEAVPSDDEPTPSEPLPGSNAIKRIGWEASADSEETEWEDGAAANAIDGDPSTYWHTNYSENPSSLPHSLTIDMGAGNVHEIGALQYVPRVQGDEANGTIKDYNIYTKLFSGDDWTKVASGSFDPTGEPATVEFEATYARFVRLEAVTTSDDGEYTDDSIYASAAEINLFPAQSDRLDPSDWTVTADSEEAPGNSVEGLASYAVDGDPNTWWHTRYSPGEDEHKDMPHELAIDLGATHELTRFEYLPRTDVRDGNGTIEGYELCASLNGQEWTELSAGEFSPTGRLAAIDLDSVEARYLKLVATSSANGGRYAGAAEVNLYGTPVDVPAAPVLTGVTDVGDVILPFGTSVEEALAALAATTTITVATGDAQETREVALEWTIAEYDGEVAGDYAATAAFVLPDDVDQSTPPMELTVTATVTVAPDEGGADDSDDSDGPDESDDSDDSDDANGSAASAGSETEGSADSSGSAADGSTGSDASDTGASGGTDSTDHADDTTAGNDAGADDAGSPAPLPDTGADVTTVALAVLALLAAGAALARRRGARD